MQSQPSILSTVPSTVEKTGQLLHNAGYIADEGLSTSLFLALQMGKALFLEGEPGVGKTELAKVISQAFDADLIRLQCYEGLDIHHAVYEWNYPRQLLAIQASQQQSDHATDSPDILANIYSEEFLLKRPLLQALDPSYDKPPILLIDELDRADEEFESFLLELLSDFQITIPELGTLRAVHRPIVIITSNRTREIHDALKRRCVYFWIDYPERQKEIDIVRLKQPTISEELSEEIIDFIQDLRQQDLYKAPGIAETIEWAQALQHLNADHLDPKIVQATLGSTTGCLPVDRR